MLLKRESILCCKCLLLSLVGIPLVQSYFGAGSGLIFLDDVICLGNESSLLDCAYGRRGSHSCDHSEDAGVRCGSTGITILILTVKLLIKYILWTQYSIKDTLPEVKVMIDLPTNY